MAGQHMIPYRERLAIALVLVLLFAATAVFKAAHKDVTQGFDELAHASYVAQLQRDGLPADLDSLRLLDPRTFRFTDRANYLNHPPPYYFALGRLGPELVGRPGAILYFRSINMLAAAAGLLACLLVGARMFAERMAFYAYAIPLFCIPVLPALAGSINNDNAAFLGGTMALSGLAVWMDRQGTGPLCLALAGLVVAAWAKLTGLLLCGTATGLILAYGAWRGRLRPVPLILAVLAFLLAALPYALFLARYGSPAPDTAAQHAMLVSGARAAGWAAGPRLSFPVYAGQFALQFLAGWMPSLTPRGLFQVAMLVLPLAAMVLAAAGVVVSARRLAQGRETALDILVLACAAALAVTLACHLWFSYQRHLATGWMMDAYPRYYLPIAPFLPLAGLSAASALERGRKLVLAFLIAGPIAFAVLGA